jgi:Protein of unknown function, DUF481
MIKREYCYRKRVILCMFMMFIIPSFLMVGQVNTEKLRKDNVKNHFEMNLGASMVLHKGNTDIFAMDTKLRLDYQHGHYAVFLVGQLAYGEKNNDSYLNKGFAHLRGVRNLGKRFKIEIFLQEEFNKFINLEERSIIGGGFRLHIIQHKKAKSSFDFSTGFGLMYEKERFSQSDLNLKKEDTSFFKSTNYISLKYSHNKFTLGNVSYIQLNIGEEESTRIYSDLNFAVKLSKVLSYTADINYRYDSNPAPNIENYDFKLKNGLTLTIK